MRILKYALFILMILTHTIEGQILVDSIQFEFDKNIPSLKILSNQDNDLLIKNSRAKDSFLKQILKLDESITLALQESSIDRGGNLHESYFQYYKGIKVENQRYNAHYNNDLLEVVNGNFGTVKNFSVIPSLKESLALKSALSCIGADEYMWEDEANEIFIKAEQNDPNASFYPKGELVIYFDDSNIPKLVYKFDIYAKSPLSRNHVYINAISGKVEGVNPLIHFISGNASTRYSGTRTIETQRTQSHFRLHDTTRGNGIRTYNMNGRSTYQDIDFIDNDNNWIEHATNKDNAALDAHWGAEMTYDYFKQKFGRNSWDNRNSPLLNYVNANLTSLSSSYSNSDNAFWDGTRMTYGRGDSYDPFTSLDIVAHEIGHGITSSTANLRYQNESGALNEGFSDIWAACVENFAKPDATNNWLIGEDVKTMRNMKNPKQFGDPDTYQGRNWIFSDVDNGGVHTNSGVLNRWFYLLANGGSGVNDNNNAYLVEGIGIDKAAYIAYLTLTRYLTSSSTFSQCRDLSIQAARSAYSGQYPSNEEVQVRNAWHAVGIGSSYPLSISGMGYICRGQTLEFFATKTGTGFNWQVSNLDIVSGQGTNRIKVKMSTTSFANCTIKVTHGSETASKVIYSDIPVISSVIGPTTVRRGSRAQFSASPNINVGGLFVPYTWRVSGTGDYYIWGTGSIAEITFNSNGMYTVICQGNSPCGNQGTGGSINVNVSDYYYSMSNLGNSIYEVKLEDNLIESVDMLSKNESIGYEVVNISTGQTVEKNKLSRLGGMIDLSHLKTGAYVINLKYSAKEFEAHKIIVK